MNATTYCQTRLEKLGITNEMNRASFWHEERNYRISVPIFEADADDNIVIHYPSLDGELMGNETKKGWKLYEAIRLKEPIGGMKYRNPSGVETRTFIPPLTVQRYREKIKIRTLIITEGQFKAFKGSMTGLDVLGIAGIHNYKDGKAFRIDSDIVKICKECEVENVVLLYDADCKDLKYKDWETEITTRLRSFAKAARRFFELLAGEVSANQFLAHIREDWSEKEGKGLDDLMLIQEPKQVAENLLLLRDSEHFRILSIQKPEHIEREFALHSVEAFYGRYDYILEEKEFVFNGGRFYFDGERLKTLRHPEASNYIRVGTDYFRIANSHDSREKKVLLPWKLSTITLDHGKKPSFHLSHIQAYNGFCNIPENNPNRYKPVVNGYYNMYHKVSKTPAAGEWKTIETYLKHVFGTELLPESPNCTQAERWIMGLDWLTILYRHPTHKLPIIALVANENNTGKSTLLFFLKDMLEENCCVIGNDEINSPFNTTYAGKLLVGIDEGFIEKRVVMEKLKSFNTSPFVYLNDKGVKQREIDCNMHFILTSNDEDNFANMDAHDSRFWVLKVPQVPKENYNPDLRAEMRSEIPAFLHFLETREIHHPRRDRFWFDASLIMTKEKMNVQKASLSHLEKAFRHAITTYFLDYQYDPVAHFTLSQLQEEIKRNSKYSVASYDVKTLMMKLGYNCSLKPIRKRRVSGYDVSGSWVIQNEPGRYYDFHAKDFLSEEELNEVFPNWQIVEDKEEENENDIPEELIPF